MVYERARYESRILTSSFCPIKEIQIQIDLLVVGFYKAVVISPTKYFRHKFAHFFIAMWPSNLSRVFGKGFLLRNKFKQRGTVYLLADCVPPRWCTPIFSRKHIFFGLLLPIGTRPRCRRLLLPSVTHSVVIKT